jgi:hypothetical protein
MSGDIANMLQGHTARDASSRYRSNELLDAEQQTTSKVWMLIIGTVAYRWYRCIKAAPVWLRVLVDTGETNRTGRRRDVTGIGRCRTMEYD